MKIALAIVFVIALCSHVSVVTCIPPGGLALTGAGSLVGSTTTTTTKPWSKKVKDGLGTFFQGAAIASAVQQGVQNSRGHKRKPSSSLASAAKPAH